MTVAERHDAVSRSSRPPRSTRPAKVRPDDVRRDRRRRPPDVPHPSAPAGRGAAAARSPSGSYQSGAASSPSRPARSRSPGGSGEVRAGGRQAQWPGDGGRPPGRPVLRAALQHPGVAASPPASASSGAGRGRRRRRERDPLEPPVRHVGHRPCRGRTTSASTSARVINGPLLRGASCARRGSTSGRRRPRSRSTAVAAPFLRLRAKRRPGQGAILSLLRRQRAAVRSRPTTRASQRPARDRRGTRCPWPSTAWTASTTSTPALRRATPAATSGSRTTRWSAAACEVTGPTACTWPAGHRVPLPRDPTSARPTGWVADRQGERPRHRAHSAVDDDLRPHALKVVGRTAWPAPGHVTDLGPRGPLPPTLVAGRRLRRRPGRSVRPSSPSSRRAPPFDLDPFQEPGLRRARGRPRRARLRADRCRQDRGRRVRRAPGAGRRA